MPPISNDPEAFDDGRGDRALTPDRPPEPVAAPKLLVSIRDGDEMIRAAACGVDIVDLKEPRRGALAPVDLALWRHAAAIWSRRRGSGPPPRLSAALGGRPEAARIAADLPAEFSFAKACPSGCDGVDKTRQLWAEVRQMLDEAVELVAVAYADPHNARCMQPEAIIETAIEAGIDRCLIDTFVKDGRSTLDHLGIDGLSQISNIARQAGLWWALAGSINVGCISQLQQHDLLPDCFGLRGDVCDRGRQGTLSTDRIQIWKTRLAEVNAADHRGQ